MVINEFVTNLNDVLKKIIRYFGTYALRIYDIPIDHELVTVWFIPRVCELLARNVDLTLLSPSEVDAELKDSRSVLEALIGAPIRTFATPYGATNASVQANAELYYDNVRNGEHGLNTMDNFDRHNIMVKEVHADTTQAMIQSWIDEAIAARGWLVLLYHRLETGDASTYNRTPTDLEADLLLIKNSGVSVQTFGEALNELLPQL